MKLSKVKQILKNADFALKTIPRSKRGFMVSFEVRNGWIFESNYFPEKHDGESLIASEEQAWDLAKKFAYATGPEVVNIYVIDSTFSPVSNYSLKKLKGY